MAAHQLGRIAGREQILVGKADGFLGVLGVDDDLAHAGLPVMDAPAVQLWRLRADRHGAGGSPGSACRRAGGFGRRFALLVDVAAVAYYDSEPFGLLSFGLRLSGLRRSVQLFESDC